MNFSLVYNNSGDSIPFVSQSPGTFEMLEHYVQKLNDNNHNVFEIINAPGIDAQCKELRDCITDINSFIYPFIDKHLPILQDTESCFDQYLLNKLHADWVNSQSVEYNLKDKKEKYGDVSDLVNDICELYPDDLLVGTVASVLSRLGLHERYGKLNEIIHDVERLFNRIPYRYLGDDWGVRIDNHFSKSLATNDICHFNIPFSHLGRPLYGKFENFDINFEHDDENSFDELLGFVALSLKQPQTIPFSKEYVAWCDKHNRTPSSRNIGIGNIVDLHNNLTEYRTIVYRNMHDTFSIEIV